MATHSQLIQENQNKEIEPIKIKAASDSLDQKSLLLNALPHPSIMVGEGDFILAVNDAAEVFLQSSASVLARHTIDYYLPFGSPVMSLIEQVRETRSPVSAYRINITNPRLNGERIVDVFATPIADNADCVALMLQEQTMAEKLTASLTIVALHAQ
jgi:two-component system nitrogen regulation sensor histidine kinase GlnL